eukprot:gene15047-18217_t
MQLGFDRQHFTLPRVGPARRTLRESTRPGLAVSSYSNSLVKGLVTDQFHLVRIVERLPAPGVA